MCAVHVKRFCPVSRALLEQLLIIVFQMKMKCTSIFSSFPCNRSNKAFSPMCLLLCFALKEPRAPVRCCHVVKRSPEKTAGFSTKPTTISSLINLGRKAHMKSAVAAALTAALRVFLGRLLDGAPQSPIAATLARGAKSYTPRAFAERRI